MNIKDTVAWVDRDDDGIWCTDLVADDPVPIHIEGTGASIWRQVPAESLDELIGKVASAHEVDAEVVAEDVTDFVEKLVDLNLLDR